MSGWHPESRDGGIPPNPNLPTNPANAFPPLVQPSGTEALYYGNGCDVRLRPAVLNSLISENLAVVDRVGLAYRPGQLINLRNGIEYIVQKGLPRYVVLTPQATPAFLYIGALDPPLSGLNNGMVLTVLPTANNAGPVRIDVGSGSWTPVLRDDTQELHKGDWPAYIPQVIAYYNGAFYQLGLSHSQVPIVLMGRIDFWIRTDGNDETGDGTENRPEKAFKTINGAWAAVGSKYSASPTSHIAFRLGVPGTYEAGSLGPYGATISVEGDPQNRAGYRINSSTDQPTISSSLQITGINSCILSGITCCFTNSAWKANGTHCVWVNGSTCRFDRCRFEILTSNGGEGSCVISTPSKSFTQQHWNPSFQIDNQIIGNGNTLWGGIFVWYNSTYSGATAGLPNPPVWSWQNLHFTTGAIQARSGSGYYNGIDVQGITNCTGPRWLASDNSTISMNGRPLPGSVNGYTGAFSSFYG